MAIESLSTAGVPDLGLQPPHIIPRVQVRKYGEQKKLFISAGLLPESPSEPGLPKSEHMVTPKVDHGESGWEEWVGRGAPYIPTSFCCLSISDLTCVSPGGTTAAPDKAKSKPTGLQGDRQVREARAGGRKAPPP